MEAHEVAAIWYDNRKAQLKILKGMPANSFVEGYSEGLPVLENTKLVGAIAKLAKAVYAHPFPEIKSLGDLACVRAVGCWHSEVSVTIANIIAGTEGEKLASLSHDLIHDLIGPMPFTVANDPTTENIH